MAEETIKFPGKAEEDKISRAAEWRPLESLRRELDRLFDEFGVGSWRSPSARGARGGCSPGPFFSGRPSRSISRKGAIITG
jgi:hypothetical protein